LTAYDVAADDDRPIDLRCRVEYSWEIHVSDPVSVLILPSRCRRFETRRRCYLAGSPKRTAIVAVVVAAAVVADNYQSVEAFASPNRR
jgi:hypothetical protein